MKNVLRCLTLATVLAAVPTLAQAQVNVSIVPAVRVRVAPPVMRVEVRPPAPSPSHVWASGYWRWQNNQHVWSAGRWEPRRPGHIWIDPHWAHENGEWLFYEGRWNASAQPYHPELVVNTAPPPPRYEIQPVAHEPGHEWIGGHWEYHSERHIWVPGRYEARPDHSRWENHRWEKTNDGHWRFNRGHWRRD